MSDTTRTIAIKAKNEAKTPLSQINNDFKHLDDSVKGLQKSFSFLTTGVVAAFGAKAFGMVKQFVGSCIDDFSQWEIQNLKLTASLNGDKEALDELGNFIQGILPKTTKTKAEIENLTAKVRLLGFSSKEVEKLVEASLTLSDVTGNGLDGTFNQLNSTLTGTAGEIAKLVPEVGDLTKEQLQSGEAIEIVIDKMGKYTSAVEDSYLVKVKNLKDSFGDLKQEIGRGWAEAFKPLIDFVNDDLQKLVKQIQDARLATEGTQKSFDLMKLVGKGDVTEASSIARSMDYSSLQAAFNQIKAANPLATDKQQKVIDQLYQILKGKQEDQRYVKPEPVPVIVEAPLFSSRVEEDNSDFEKLIESLRKELGLKEINTGIDDVVAEELLKGSSENKGFDLFDNMDFGSLFSSALGEGGALSIFSSALAPLISTLTSFAGPMAILVPVVEGLVSVIEPAISGVIQPLMTALTSIGQLIGNAIVPLITMLAPGLEIISNIIMTVLTPIINMLAAPIAVVASVFEILQPILKANAVAFEILTSPIKFLADLFTWVSTTIKTAIHNLVEFIDHPINENKRNVWNYSKFSSDAFTGLGDRIEKIWNADYGNSTSNSSNSSSSGSTISSTVQRDIIVNNYIGYLVGSDGMDEFTYIVRDKLDELGVFNR